MWFVGLEIFDVRMLFTPTKYAQPDKLSKSAMNYNFLDNGQVEVLDPAGIDAVRTDMRSLGYEPLAGWGSVLGPSMEGVDNFSYIPWNRAARVLSQYNRELSRR